MNKKIIFLGMLLVVFFAGCGMFSPAPPERNAKEWDYSFLEEGKENIQKETNPEETELKLSFSEGKTVFDSKASEPHWKITEIEFNAESNENKVFEAVIEILDEERMPAGNSVNKYVNLVKGKQKINLSQLGIGIKKRGKYAIKINFYETGKLIQQYEFESVIGATGFPIKKEVQLEVTEFTPKQKEFNYDCSTYIGFNHKIKVSNTGNTELFGKTVSEVYFNGEKMKAIERTGFNLFLEYPQNEKSIEIDDSISKDNSCYFGETLKLKVKFIDNESQTIAEKTLEQTIIKDE